MNVEQQHWARHVPQASVAMDAHAELIAPQPGPTLEVVQRPDEQVSPALQAPLLRHAQFAVPGVQPEKVVQVPDEQVSPALQAPLLRHAQFAVPGVQPELLLPQPGLRVKAVPRTSAQNRLPDSIRRIRTFISNSPFVQILHSQLSSDRH
jgi:hypothetical protein